MIDSLDKNRNAWRGIQQAWGTARYLWGDAIRQQFEKEFWQEFEQIVPTTLEAMRRLNDVIARAQREVR